MTPQTKDTIEELKKEFFEKFVRVDKFKNTELQRVWIEAHPEEIWQWVEDLIDQLELPRINRDDLIEYKEEDYD